MPVISFRNFSFRYSNLKEPTLKEINLEIEAGQKVLIAGPSGSGKSTLAHCINGLIPFTYRGKIGGTLEVLGIKPYECDRSIYEVSQYVGTILQDQDGQFVGLSVGEDVAFAAENKALPQPEIFEVVARALQEVGMAEYIREVPHNLSGGQKQKVSIAGILTNDTEILLFDEPLANLDPASGKRAMATISDIQKRSGKTVIVVEHRIEDVLEYDFDRIVVISEGRIVADGHPDEILATNVLAEHGLREPLYLEALKRVAQVRPVREDRISAIANIGKYKAAMLQAYRKADISQPAVPVPTVLQVNSVSYRYFENGPDIIKDVSFEVKKGETLAILGNNGAGKSTLLKILSGTVKPQRGTIQYLGESIDDWSVKRRGQIIGCVLQNPNQMITKEMIFDEVAFALRNYGYPESEVAERVNEALRICGLVKYRKWPVDSLSYGQKKRVTIASILAMQPQVIILDEPTAGQDHRTYREFMDFLERIRANGVSVVMITHDLHLALEYAQRALVLSGGKVIADDTVFTVLTDRRVLEQANLKETSIFKMAHLYEIEDACGFASFLVRQLKGGASR